MNASRPIVVLGAGVIGLTTAVRLLESPLHTELGHPIHIVANHLPNDPLDANYASTIAGAHHLSFADDNDHRQRKWDKSTFRIMYDEWRRYGEKTGLMALKQTELYVGTDKHLQIYEEHPDFAVLDPSISELPVDHLISFTSLTMTPAIYLNSLLERIHHLSNGSTRVHRHHVTSLTSFASPQLLAILGNIPPLAVIVCAGIGALTLGGVEDQSIYPIRGQVVKVRAPWVRSGWTRQVGSLDGSEGGQRTYVIPRPNGEVILGGTREVGDWNPYPREETKHDILRRALEICPALQPPHQLAVGLDNELPIGSKSSIESCIIDNLVGFRPARTGGVRLERGEDVALGDKIMMVVHNYGHGGAGWQSCWGTADDAVDLLQGIVAS